MEFNPEVTEILKEFKINRSAGLLFLLGVYHGLEVDTVVPEEVIQAMNLTKIVERDYSNNTVKWNTPLFSGQETAFDWVADWIDAFGRRNPDRRGVARDAISRMKVFFSKHPQYRKEDVYAARDLYLSGVADSKYIMKSHKFIYDGIGAMKKSTLLEYCERVVGTETVNNLKGTIIS